MSLKEIKKRLATDQKNLVRAEVLSVTGSSSRVRLADGRVVTAGADGYEPRPGDTVEVSTTGDSFLVQRKGKFAALDGERVIDLTYSTGRAVSSAFSTAFG